jgi:TolB-like protein
VPTNSLRPVHRHVSFGIYELDLHARELRKQGLRVKLQQKPFDLLAALLERPGGVVTRDELRQRLWPKETFGDLDHSLSIAVHKIRIALHDTAENPRFIETLAGRGYRFLAPVRVPENAVRSSGRVMLAVLPFDNVDADPTHEYFVDGMTDELISSLAITNPQKLAVIARTSIMQYKRSARPLAEIARELRVEYVLEGSVRRTAKRTRIHARLIQASDQAQMWAGTYDRPLKDIVSLQAEVAANIAEALAVELIPESKSWRENPPTQNLEAYELYLRGRAHWVQKTESRFSEALGCFQKAIAADPRYSLAYAGVADCYAVFGFYGLLPPREAYEKAKAAAVEALNLNPLLPEAHSALAFVTLQYDWDWNAAEKRHLQAVALSPNYAAAHHWYGIALTQMGRFHDGLTTLQKAGNLDPISSAVQAQIGWVYYFSRDFELAVKQLDRVVKADPGFALARYFLSMACVQAGHRDAAVREAREAVRLTEGHPACVAALVSALQANGKNRDAGQTLRKLEAMCASRHVSPYWLAFSHAALGEAESAIEKLDHTYEERSGWMLYLKIEPAFDAVRMDERVVELLQRTQAVQRGEATRAANA